MTQPDSTTEPDDFDDAAPDKAPADSQDELAKWKSLARKHEQSAKANASAARRLSELEEAGKTETQRLTDRITATERERDEARTEATRVRLGLRYKLNEDDLDFLGTGTDTDLEARAKRLSERSGGRPAGDVDQGVRGTAGPTDMNALIRRGTRR